MKADVLAYLSKDNYLKPLSYNLTLLNKPDVTQFYV